MNLLLMILSYSSAVTSSAKLFLDPPSLSHEEYLLKILACNKYLSVRTVQKSLLLTSLHDDLATKVPAMIDRMVNEILNSLTTPKHKAIG